MARSLALVADRPPAAGRRGLRSVATRAPAVALAIVGAWLLLAGAQLSGTSDLLHHHALIAHGPALWIALPAFLAAWLVMVVAMMLPASLPAIASHLSAVGRARAADTGAGPGPRSRPLASFLAPYALVWAGFGVAVFLGDTLVHGLVHATPWLEARTWLIDAAVLALAGAYQLLPAKRQSLETCRHPGVVPFGGGGRFGPGLDHALACLATSGALMLLMFSEGFSSPAWMVGLTAVMAYEATGRHGQVVAKLVGVLLLLLAVGVVATGRAV